jgi:hypothetical protein
MKNENRIMGVRIVIVGHWFSKRVYHFLFVGTFQNFTKPLPEKK